MDRAYNKDLYRERRVTEQTMNRLKRFRLTVVATAMILEWL